MNKIFNPLENIDKFILICVGLLGILSLTMLESTVYEDGFVLARPVLIQAIAYLLGFGVLLSFRIWTTAFLSDWKKSSMPYRYFSC